MQVAQVLQARKAREERRRVGVATIADVLQARTAASQAQLDLQTTEGTVQTARGALALALGPALGGVISQHLHWGWIFLINVPVGVITFAVAVFYVLPSLLHYVFCQKYLTQMTIGGIKG